MNQTDLLPIHRATHRGSLLLSALLVLASAFHVRADYVLSNAWKVANGTGNLDASTGNNANRSISYSAVSNQIFVANKTTTSISVFDGSTGALIGSVNMSGVSGSGTFQINQIAVADDGVLYGASLTTALGASSLFKIYRWDDWSQPPITAFTYNGSGDAALVAGRRLGDNIAITGSGVNTLIVVPAGNGTTPTATNLLFSTTDGTNFTPKVLSISILPPLSAGNGPAFGVTFFTNNSYLLQPSGSSAYLVQYPASFASLSSPVAATVIATNPVSGGNNVLLSYNSAAGLLAAYGPMVNSAPSSVPLNLFGVPPLSGVSSAVAITNTAHTNGNPNFVGGVTFGGPSKTNYIYALDADNGVFAVAILFVPPQPPAITTAPQGTTGTFPPYTLAVTATGSKPLSYQWLVSPTGSSGSFTNIPGAIASTNVISGPGTNYYEVLITNSVGSITS